MDLKKLNVFLTVADLGNFTKAGEVLGYTQSGVEDVRVEYIKTDYQVLNVSSAIPWSILPIRI